jgi:hypothetical protein
VARYVRSRRRSGAEGLLELHDLDGDLDHEPVVLAQVKTGDFDDPAQALA